MSGKICFVFLKINFQCLSDTRLDNVIYENFTRIHCLVETIQGCYDNFLQLRCAFISRFYWLPGIHCLCSLFKFYGSVEFL